MYKSGFNQISWFVFVKYLSPEYRACLRATYQGCTKCGGTSSCQRSWHREKFRRKADKKGFSYASLTKTWSHFLYNFLQIIFCNFNCALSVTSQWDLCFFNKKSFSFYHIIIWQLTQNCGFRLRVILKKDAKNTKYFRSGSNYKVLKNHL